MFAGALVLVPLALLLPARGRRPARARGHQPARRRDRARHGGGAAARRHRRRARASSRRWARSRGGRRWPGRSTGSTPGGCSPSVFLVAACAHTLVLALTEVTWPRPTGTRRSGLLVRRRRRRRPAPAGLWSPRRCSPARVVVTGLVGVVAADGDGRRPHPDPWTGGTEPSAARRPARSPARSTSCPCSRAWSSLAALVGLALHLVVSRPAVAGADAATDTALRRAGAHRVLRGAACGAGLTLAGLLLTAGNATRGVADDGATRLHWRSAWRWLVAGGVAGLVGLLAARRAGPAGARPRAAATAARSPRSRRDRPAAARGRPGLGRAAVRADPGPGGRPRRGRGAAGRRPAADRPGARGRPRDRPGDRGTGVPHARGRRRGRRAGAGSAPW